MQISPILILAGLAACADKDASHTGSDDTSASPDDTSTGDDTDAPDDTAPAPEPYGPDNAWYHAPDASLVPEEPDSADWSLGSQVPNLRFTDQNGDEVWLYQFYGQNIYLDWVAEWCAPCAAYAPYLDAFYQDHSADAVVLTILYQDLGFGDGDADAVSRWVEEFGSTNPVVWLDADELDRTRSISTFPTIDLVDPELRLAQKELNALHGDGWIAQVIDRMVFAIGGSLDNDAEICGDGLDNDLDLIADCMDDACAEDAACAPSEISGSVSPCTPDPDGVATTVDVWEVEVRGAVASLEGDSGSASTGFDQVLYAKSGDQSWDDARVVGDDDWDCSWPLDTYGCAQGWLRPGTWQLMVKVGTGGSSYDGDCADPDLGEYVIHFLGDATMTLVQDDVQLGDL